MSKLAKKDSWILHHNSMFVDLLKTILYFPIAFKKEEYRQTFVASRVFETVKNMMSSDFLTEMSAQLYYRYILFAEMVLRDDGVFSLVESLNGKNGNQEVWASSISIMLG